MNLNIKDQKILYELDLNSRQPNSKIAKKVGLSEQVVGYRINRLMEEGIIERTLTLLNPAILGYTHFKVYLRLQNVSPTIENRFIQDLNSNPYSFWVVSSRGRWDIIVSFFAKSAKKFGKLFREILNKYDKYILERNVVAIEEAPSFSRGYLNKEKEKKEFMYGGEPEIIKLNEDETKILSLLCQDSRVSLLEIAKKLDLTSEAIRIKLKKLEKTGIIQHYGLVLNLKKIGYESHLISLTFNNLNKLNWNKIITFCKLNKNILFIPRCIGNHDVDFEVEVKNTEELNSLMDEIRKQFNDILRDFEDVIITKQHKFNYFPLGAV